MSDVMELPDGVVFLPASSRAMEGFLPHDLPSLISALQKAAAKAAKSGMKIRVEVIISDDGFSVIETTRE